MTRLAVLSALFLALAGCAGTGNLIVGPPTCRATPAPPYPQLLYPVSASTGIATPSVTLVLAFSGSPGAYGTPVVTGSVVPPAVGTLEAPPNPLPSPMASPPPGTTLQGVTVGSLQPHTTYTVSYFATAPCAPGGTVALHPIGSFTTQ